MLTLGIPKEIKPAERRVALIPEHVGKLADTGATVYVQKSAGALSGYPDRAYMAAGARLVAGAADLYGRSDIILKVKEPLEPEYPLLRKGQVVFCFLHLASPEQKALIRALLESGVTAIGYETLRVEGRLPALAPMSEIAGGLAALYALYFRSLKFVKSGGIEYPAGFNERLEKIAAEYPEVPLKNAESKAIIFGGGTAGRAALKVLERAKVSTILVEKFRQTLESLVRAGHHAVLPEDLEDKDLAESDILIGAAHSPGCRAVKVLEQARLARASAERMKVMIDIAIDQGGNFPEARSTTYADPLYRDSAGNIRFSVANLPAFCGHRASEALSEVTLPYVQALLRGAMHALTTYPELKSAVNIADGKIKMKPVEEVYREQ